MRSKNAAEFSDYEGYSVFWISPTLFVDNYAYSYTYLNGVYDVHHIIPIDDTQFNDNGNLKLSITEHPELLQTAKKLFFHHDCTIPRDIVAKKYKRCIDPLKADAVIIPKYNSGVEIKHNIAVFINEEKKRIYMCNMFMYDNDVQIMNARNRLNNAPAKIKAYKLFGNMVKYKGDDGVLPQIGESELLYFGTVASFSSKQDFLYDIFSYKILPNKIVYEDSVMVTINDESNIPNVDTLISIAEMLDSNDEEIVAVGLKSLAALNYVDYPESVRFILTDRSYWRYNKAKNSTTVKYMLSKLNMLTGRPYNGSSRFIDKKDYELLRNYMDKASIDISYISHLPFMYYDESLIATPRFYK